MSIGPEIRLVVANMRAFKAEMDKADKARRKAGQTAVKVEGYRLMKVLKGEMRAGAPGGRKLEPLRVISGGKPNRKPLAALARNAVRYMAMGRGAHFQVSVGFLFVKSSHSWVRIAARQQEGFTTAADSIAAGGTATLRQSFIRRGSALGKKNARSKYFFLRKSTKELRTPARPVIDPFWAAHELEAERNIISNFNRKLAG